MLRSFKKRAKDYGVLFITLRKIVTIWINCWRRATNVCKTMQNKSINGCLNPILYLACDHTYRHRNGIRLIYCLLSLYMTLIIITYRWRANTYKNSLSLTASRKYSRISLDRSSGSSRPISFSLQLFTSRTLRKGTRIRAAIEWLREFPIGKSTIIQKCLRDDKESFQHCKSDRGSIDFFKLEKELRMK